MPTLGIANDIILIVVFGLVGGALAHRLKQPVLLGYILAGIALGPHTGGLTVSGVEDIEVLADLGVALLMFGVGLEFSLRKLRPVWRMAVLGTPIQIAVTIAVWVWIGGWLDLAWREGLWLGAVVSLSSTMAILKTIISRGLLGTLSSRVMVGTSVVQDLALIPMMLILPTLGDLGTGFTAVGWAAARTVVFIGAMVVLGTRVVPAIMRYVARWNSRELFQLTVTALGIGVGYLTYLFGLGMALGAFAAGMVLSESDYGRQALSDIIPIRDLFGLLFFASVGMLLDPAHLAANLGTVASVVGLVIVTKGIIFVGLSRLFGYSNIVPFAVGLTMFPVGELSFVLARIGVNSGAISPALYSLILSTAIITILLTPILSLAAEPAYRLRRRLFRHRVLDSINIPSDGFRDHVIIAGGGRIGTYIARVLMRMNLPFVIIEMDQHKLDGARREGLPVIFGDASQPTVLEMASIQKARILIITVPSPALAQATAKCQCDIAPGLRVVARAESVDDLRVLRDTGIYEIILPHFEASLEMTRQALLHLDVEEETIASYADAVRHELYEPLLLDDRGPSRE